MAYLGVLKVGSAISSILEDMVITLLLRRQALTFAPPVGHFGVSVEFLQSLIFRVGQPECSRLKPRLAVFEKLKVMHLAFTVGGADDALRLLVENHLGL